MHRSVLTAGGLISIAAGVMPLAALAQDGGLQLRFGIENRIEVVRNPDLAVPAEGTSVANVTALSFGLLTETGIDRFDLAASGALIVENPADSSGTDVDFGRSALTFGYTREVPAAIFEIAGRFRTDDVGAFDTGVGDDDADGTETQYGLSTRLEIGRTSPLGFAIGAGFDVTEYDDTTDPDLFDSKEARADIAVILRFSEIMTGRLGLRYARLEEDDATATVTETLGASAGLQYAVTERLDLGIDLGLTRIDVDELGVVDRTEGPEARVRLDYEMPVGTAFAELRIATSDDDEGERVTFEFGRALETPLDTLSARLGLTHSDPSGTDVIGAVEWTRNMPDGSFGLGLTRSVSFDSDDAETTESTILSLDWNKQINERGQVSLGIDYALENAPSERIEQTDFGASYSHSLTADWNLNGGVGYTIRNDADGRAESPRLFVSLSRDFEFRP